MKLIASALMVFCLTGLMFVTASVLEPAAVSGDSCSTSCDADGSSCSIGKPGSSVQCDCNGGCGQRACCNVLGSNEEDVPVGNGS